MNLRYHFNIIILSISISKIDSLKNHIDEQKIIINNASNTISYLNSIISSYGVIFSILTIFIAIIALAIPIMTYQFGIKPSQKALKDLESNMDARLIKYLREKRNKDITDALANISGGNNERKSQALSYLSITSHEGFTDNQIFEIFTILNRNLNDNNIKNQLSYILTIKKNEFADQFFNNENNLKDSIIEQMAILYFIKTGISNNHKGLSCILNGSSDQYNTFIRLLFNLIQSSSKEVKDLINDINLIDLLSQETLKKIKQNFPLNVTGFDFNSVYLNSYLFTKVNK
jgi:hypothetical protein